MTRTQAERIDQGSKFVDYEEETNSWGVFGTESGFCYSVHTSKDEAERAAR